MAELSDLSRNHKGLATYMDDMRLGRPDVHKSVMDKPESDRPAAIQKLLETDMQKAQASQGQSRILPDWLPNFVRPESEIAAEKAEKNRWDSLVSARQGLEKYKTELATLEKTRTEMARAKAENGMAEINVTMGDPAKTASPVVTAEVDAKAKPSPTPTEGSPAAANTEKSVEQKSGVDFRLTSNDNFGKDEKVATLRQELEKSQYYIPGEDKAVEKALQRKLNAENKAGLTVDGDVGPLTRTALRAASGKQNPDGSPITTEELASIHTKLGDPAATVVAAVVKPEAAEKQPEVSPAAAPIQKRDLEVGAQNLPVRTSNAVLRSAPQQVAPPTARQPDHGSLRAIHSGKGHDSDQITLRNGDTVKIEHKWHIKNDKGSVVEKREDKNAHIKNKHEIKFDKHGVTVSQEGEAPGQKFKNIVRLAVDPKGNVTGGVVKQYQNGHLTSEAELGPGGKPKNGQPSLGTNADQLLKTAQNQVATLGKQHALPKINL